MVAPATTAPDGSVTVPLSRAVVYWAHTDIIGPKTSMSPKEKQMNQCPGNRLRNFLFIVCLPYSQICLRFSSIIVSRDEPPFEPAPLSAAKTRNARLTHCH